MFNTAQENRIIKQMAANTFFFHRESGINAAFPNRSWRAIQNMNTGIIAPATLRSALLDASRSREALYITILIPGSISGPGSRVSSEKLTPKRTKASQASINIACRRYPTRKIIWLPTRSATEPAISKEQPVFSL